MHSSNRSNSLFKPSRAVALCKSAMGVAAMVTAALAGSASSALATEFKTIYTFNTDEAIPETGLVADKAGNLYGTTYETNSYGSVFKLAPDGTFTTLYQFQGQPDGQSPYGGRLILDKAGNIYGTTG